MKTNKNTIFFVHTTYKCGRTKTELINAPNEFAMWKYYYKHHRQDTIDEVTITGHSRRGDISETRVLNISEYHKYL